jgi:hypothetical protein
MMSAPLASPGALAYGSVRYISELILIRVLPPGLFPQDRARNLRE